MPTVLYSGQAWSLAVPYAMGREREGPSLHLENTNRTIKINTKKKRLEDITPLALMLECPSISRMPALRREHSQQVQ